MLHSRSTNHSAGRTRFFRALAALLLLAAWALAWGGAAAQAWPGLNGAVADNTGKLDAGKVNSAAGSLRSLGVKPLAVLFQNRGSYSNSLDLGHAAAKQYGLESANDIVNPYLFAIVVVLDTRESSLIYGDNLKAAFEQPSRSGSGTVADQIRSQTLGPGLAAGNYSDAFSNTFGQAAQEIKLFRNPPTPTPVPTPVPPVQIDTQGIGNAILWGLGIVIVVVALAIALPVFFRTRRQRKEAETRRRVLGDQLAQARNVAADMITDLDFPADPQQQIQYRFLDLALASERPQQLAAITGRYEQVYQQVSNAETQFSSLNQATYNTEQELMQGIAGYQGVQKAISDARAFLDWLDQTGKQLSAQRAGAPGEADQAKKAIAAATDALARLAAAASDLYPVQPARALVGASARLSQAEAALEAKPPMELQAYDAATSSRSLAEAFAASLAQLEQAYAALAAQRGKLDGLRKKGYKLSQAEPAFAQVLAGLSQAAKALESGNTGAFSSALTQSSSDLQKAAALVDAQVALRDSNEQLLASQQASGQEIKTYIEQGAQAFDKVDEYAESSWEDIRGNGTEAQDSADRAYALWQEAQHLNSLAPDSPQDFEGARQRMDQATAELNRARELIAAILDRLQHLEESKRTAQAEIAAAAQDVAAGQGFVSKYDPDISPNPDDMLKQAATLVAQAREEAGKPKPDWIKVVALARQANDTADKALADARSQTAAMEARRLRLQTVTQQAAASASRSANYVQAHRPDLDNATVQAMTQAQGSIQQAQAMAAQTQNSGLEDVALGNALEQAVAALVAAQALADNTYNQASQQVQEIDTLRRSVYKAVQDATFTINMASSYIQQYQSVVDANTHSLLQSAVRKLPKLNDRADAVTLRKMMADAQEAQNLANRAYQQAQQEAGAYAPQQTNQDNLGTDIAVNIAGAVIGGLIGSALSGGGRHHHGGGLGGFGGWGGGRSSGGGFGGFGGGGSSSGGWGGGGSSSGGFGGGGSSGGSWGGGGSSSGGW